MAKEITLGERQVGPGRPAYVVAEIGINHNGDIELAKRMIDFCVEAGCDAVKFQKRTPELCVPAAQRDILRETPWGVMSYMDYRSRIEFGEAEYREIDSYCRTRQIQWFASSWDIPSVDFMEQFEPACHKISSASLTDDDLLKKCRQTGRPVVLSTGMSTMEEMRHAVEVLGQDDLAVLHSTSTYPCAPSELNLRMISTLQKELDCPVGYSGHEVGLQTTLAAVVLGACFIERHVTLDRAMWGSDQAASVEPAGLKRLVRDIRVIEQALGSGVKTVYPSEEAARSRLRLGR